MNTMLFMMQLDPKIDALFIILFLASVKDMHDRIIPDWMPFLIMLISMMPAGLPHPAGILACLPLLIAGIIGGGVGGGDIKIVAATGTILGFAKTFMGLMAAMILMIIFHFGFVTFKKIKSVGRAGKQINSDYKKERNHVSYPMVPFIFIGMLIMICLVN